MSTDSASPGPADVVAAVDASGCTTSAECDDDNICTDDTCTAGGYCKHVALSGLSCNDGNACTEDDRCTVDAICAGTSAVSCDDGNPCTSDECQSEEGCVYSPEPDGTACEDGTACTQGDQCKEGACQPGGLVECQDQNPEDCLYATCNPETGECNDIQTHPQGYPCMDGNPCTDGDACDALGKCKSGPPHQCVSQHPCRTAWCNEQAKENTNPCVLEWKSAGVGCDDGDLCTTEMLNEGVSNLTTGRP